MIIRHVRHTVVVAATAIAPLTFITPGGNWTWEVVRITNYSPWMAQVTNTSDAFNNPVQILMPFQQNVYQYSAQQGTIIGAFTWVTTTPHTGFFMCIEYGDTLRCFPGGYPVFSGS